MLFKSRAADIAEDERRQARFTVEAAISRLLCKRSLCSGNIAKDYEH
jgi:hypothetical protein